MNEDEEAIAALIEAWHRATCSGDVGSILPLMTEDVIFLTPGNPPIEGRETFESGLRESLSANDLESSGEIRELKVSGDLAYAWSALEVTIKPKGGGESMSRSGYTLPSSRKTPAGSGRYFGMRI